jgi:RimJ/RimL family protein N-acetyltransferase
MALVDHWPLLGLRVTTPRVELRYPDDELVAAVLEVAARGVHPPDQMPFGIPWTRAAPEELPRRSLQQWHWRNRADLAPASWSVDLAVLVGGDVVGVQGLSAKDFAVRRGVLSGSWLGMAHQRRGIGTEMREAILHLAFAGLGAAFAETAAWDDNAASNAVTRKLGYEPAGDTVEAREGAPARMVHYRMARSWWETHLRREDVTIEGLEPCLALLGAADG